MRNAIALLLSLSPSLLVAQRVAEVEPNNIVINAQPLLFGQQVDCTLAAGEQDWFTFSMTGSGEVHVSTSGNFGVNPSVDTVALLYDATGTSRLAWDDGARSSHSDIGVTLSPGVYTVLVIGKTATTSGAYSIDLVRYAPAVIHTVEAAEPNGDPGFGETPTPIHLDDTFSGSLHAPTDQDWFTFTLATDSIVQAFVYDDSKAPQLDNTHISLREQLIPGQWSTIGTAGTLSTSHRAFNLAHPGYLPAGTYAFVVTSGTVAAGTAPQNYVKTGHYAVRTRMIALPGFSMVDEAAEPNEDSNTAPFMMVGDSARGFCSGANEADWFELYVPAPMTLAVMTENGAVPAITDTTVRLHDAAGNLLIQATSGGPSTWSHGKFLFAVPAAGFYYVAVAGGVMAATGNYILRTGGASPMLQPATFVQQPPSTNACFGSNGMHPELNRAANEVAQLGTNFTMRVNGALPNAGVVSMLGFSNALANPGKPLPLDLAPYGAPTCFLRVDPAMTSLGVADAGGSWIWDQPIPNDSYLNGLVFYVQAACFDAALNAFGISVSNDCKVVVGDRGY